MDITRRRELVPKLVLPLILGAAAAASAVFATEMKASFMFALLGGMGLLVIALCFANLKALTFMSIIFLGLGIPFNLDVNLFYRTYVGVTSVDIGLSLLSASALVALFIYRHYTSKEQGPAFRYNRMLLWAPLFYMLAGFFSLYNAASPELTVLELIRLAMLFAIFFVVMSLKDRGQVSALIITLSVGVILEAGIAFYQYKTGHVLGLKAFGEGELGTREVWYAGSRASGTIGHANILAYYFEILIPLMFAMFLVEENGRVKLWYLFALVAGLVGILTTLSRAGWMSVPVSLSIVFFSLVGRKIMEARYLSGLFVVAALLAVLVVFMYPTLHKRFVYEDYGSAAVRAPLNKAALSIAKRYPLTGVGLNNLAKVFKTYDTTGGSARFGTSTHVVHNLYLAVLSETGAIGLIAFLYIFAATFIVAFKTWLRAPRWQRGVAVGAAAGLIAQMIHGFADPGFRIVMNVSMLVYASFGLVGAASVMTGGQDEGAAACPSGRKEI